jgi:hypothetical protein
MADFYQERYHAVAIGVNGVFNFPSGTPTNLAGFLCVTSGTLTAARANGQVLISGFPCTAGVYYPMPFHLGMNGVVTLAGGASGTLGVS